jgi:cytochrome c
MTSNALLSIAAAALVVALSATGASAQAMPKGDAAAGEKVFVACKICHVTDKGVNRIGPSLFGVVGRKASAVPGYTYSAASHKSGLTWDAATLFAYLEAPQKVMPGTKMAFGGVKDPQKRADLIAYLSTKK